MPLLSIVVPVYNEERTVERLIEAVLIAPLPDGVEREIVVVDDASTDETARVLAPYAADPRIRVLRHEVNRGKGAALRSGFADTRWSSMRRSTSATWSASGLRPCGSVPPR